MLAAYAVAVALNGFLPANIGTIVMMLMLVGLIAGATFAAIFSGLIVQKIPFRVLSVAMYVYLFVTVSGSLSIKLDVLADHPMLSAVVMLGAIALLALLARIFWRRPAKIRQRLKCGGAILGQPRRFVVGVMAPAVASFGARLAIVAVADLRPLAQRLQLQFARRCHGRRLARSSPLRSWSPRLPLSGSRPRLSCR